MLKNIRVTTTLGAVWRKLLTSPLPSQLTRCALLFVALWVLGSAWYSRETQVDPATSGSNKGISTPARLGLKSSENGSLTLSLRRFENWNECLSLPDYLITHYLPATTQCTLQGCSSKVVLNLSRLGWM